MKISAPLLQRFKEAATGEGPQLTPAELEQLSRVTDLGDDFLRDLRDSGGLTQLDLSPLHSVTSIGSYFLSYCSDITTLDLLPLRNVTRIGNNFLEGCRGLRRIDLSPLSSVTSIAHCFLYVCSGIKHVDLAPLRSVTSVGNYFLAGCGGGLSLLQFSPLATKLGWNGADHGEFGRLFAASNKQRIADLHLSWHARKTALLIRNFAPRDHASDALKVWNVMKHVVQFLSPLRVPDAVLIGEEKRMLQVVGARGA